MKASNSTYFRSTIVKSYSMPYARLLKPWIVYALYFAGILMVVLSDNILLILLGSAFMLNVLIVSLMKNRIKDLGRLEIGNKWISIETNSEKKNFPLSELSGLGIIRGSRFHNSDIGFGDTVKNKNHIIFTYKDKAYNFEFLIHSKAHNIEFEQMLAELGKQGVTLAYSSV